MPKLNRSLHNICAHIKSFSFLFVAFSLSRPPPPYILFLNLLFCVCPPLTCSRRTEGRSTLEQLYFLLTCSFPSPTLTEEKYMPAQPALCFTALGQMRCQSRSLQGSTAIPPAFIEGKAPKQGTLQVTSRGQTDTERASSFSHSLLDLCTALSDWAWRS